MHLVLLVAHFRANEIDLMMEHYRVLQPILDRAGYFARMHPKRSYVLGIRLDGEADRRHGVHRRQHFHRLAPHLQHLPHLDRVVVINVHSRKRAGKL